MENFSEQAMQSHHMRPRPQRGQGWRKEGRSYLMQEDFSRAEHKNQDPIEMKKIDPGFFRIGFRSRSFSRLKK
jgi:hypothetical protein